MIIDPSSQLLKIMNEDIPVKIKTETSENVNLVKMKKIKDPEGKDYTAGTLSEFSNNQLSKIIEEWNSQLVGKDVKLTYKVHETTKKTIVSLVDVKTDEIIREIPSEKMLDLIAKIWDSVGILVNKKG